MKTQTLGLLAILSLGVGLTSFSSADMFQETTVQSSSGESIGLSGHVTVLQRDAQSNIIAYQQYDNVIINEGLNCTLEYLFKSSNATCASASQTEQFDFIGLLGTVPAPQIEDTAASGITRLSGTGLDPVVATTITSINEASGTGSTQTTTTAFIQHEFTKTGAGGITVGGATLETGASDSVFAAKAFTGGDLTLNENDTLEITWEITLG